MSGIVQVLQLLSAGLAAIAAFYWLKASDVTIHWSGVVIGGRSAKKVSEQLRDQTRFNKLASFAAGWCAVCQSLTACIPVFAIYF
jgi:hypothetical protein